jgi:hypothetical protein
MIETTRHPKLEGFLFFPRKIQKDSFFLISVEI